MGTDENTNSEGGPDTWAVSPQGTPPPTPTGVNPAFATTAIATKTCCAFCGENFASRSALFRHLQRQADGCSAPRLDPGEKVMLLFGYRCCSIATVGGTAAEAKRGRGEDGGGNAVVVLSGINDASASAASVVAGGDSAGERILEAMGISGFEERTAGVNGAGAKPVGFSQASSVGSRRCPLLAQELGVSATADTVCLKAPTTVPVTGIRAWLHETNMALAGSGVKILGRMRVPHDLHAEAHATRRRYEYLIPAWLLDATAEGPWTGPARGEDTLIPLLKDVRALSFKPFGSCNVLIDGKRRRRRPLWHNFSAEALPHSPSAARRLYRYYSHSTVIIRDVDYVCVSISGDAFVDRQVRGMVGLAVAAARGLIDAEQIAACIDPTRQEDMFHVPLAPLPPCWLAEVGYSTWQTKLGGVCMSPAAAKRLAHPLEGWSDEATRSVGFAFRQAVQESAARWWASQPTLGVDWLNDVLRPGATKLRAELAAANNRAARAAADAANVHPRGRKKLSVSEEQFLSATPQVYTEVLRLLREADVSGLWPASTPARDSVIQGGAAKKKAPPAKSYSRRAGSNRNPRNNTTKSDDNEGLGGSDGGGSSEIDEGEQEEDVVGEDNDDDDSGKDHEQLEAPAQAAPHGGSFTVGSFPPPCPPPRGNTLFPELTRAAFELEALLLPDRPPSTTIAVNRHAQFRPHIDSGTGAGQSVSLIVGLGDYVEGQLVVEGEEVDIRYCPLEFNGWTQRHWTRPFKGERFSLVWFTPKGCEALADGECIFPGGPRRTPRGGVANRNVEGRENAANNGVGDDDGGGGEDYLSLRNGALNKQKDVLRRQFVQ